MDSFVTDSNGTEPWIRRLLSQHGSAFFFFHIPSNFVIRKIQKEGGTASMFLMYKYCHWRHTAIPSLASSILCSLLNSTLSLKKSALHKSLLYTPFVRVGPNASVHLCSFTSLLASKLTKIQRRLNLVPESWARFSATTQRFFPTRSPSRQTYSFPVVAPSPKSTVLSYYSDTNNHCCWNSS